MGKADSVLTAWEGIRYYLIMKDILQNKKHKRRQGETPVVENIIHG